MKINSYFLMVRTDTKILLKDFNYIYPPENYLHIKDRSPAYYYPYSKDLYKNSLVFFCPCGSGSHCRVTAKSGKGDNNHWGLTHSGNGIFTLSPSILHSHTGNEGNECHFYIRNSTVEWC